MKLASGAALLALFLCRPAFPQVPAHRFYVSSEEDRRLDARALTGRVVARVREECDLAGKQGSGPPVAEGARIIVMAPRQALASIAARGFLNWHQTGSTRGFHRDRFAIEQELAMARLPYDEKGRALLPKYAVLDLRGTDAGHFALPTRYGDVAFILKKEVSSRATWTYADSLDFEAQTGRFEPVGAANPVLARTFAYRRKPGDRNRCGNYCEAQIWGDLSLSDVAYAMIPAGAPAPRALRSAGLDVYSYAVGKSSADIVAPDHAAQYVRGPRLWEARPRAQTAPDAALRPPPPSDEEARALALYARSDEAWTAFKPALLAALRDKSPLLATEAVAFASEHRDDPDVAAALRDARKLHADDHDLNLEEWLDRLDKNRFCE